MANHQPHSSNQSSKHTGTSQQHSASQNKSDSNKSQSRNADDKSGSRGGSHEQHVEAGRQSHKNS
ncbi:hypothetical protein [Silvimonas soli]|uniref:hypothetical protein n=1 Tax=Silvimonas soli TaxID=2980100 RepID=UPI0024B34327|nr:hypothetical protein [Silvimonas soli]